MAREQPMYDGTTKTFEKISREHTAMVIATRGDKVAIVLQYQPDREEPFYDFLGGRINDGEDPLPGAKRELLEEAGFVSDDWELIANYELNKKIDRDSYRFVARNVQQVQEAVPDEGEKIELKWMSLDEVFELVKTDQLFDPLLKADRVTKKLDGEWEAFCARVSGRA